MSHVEQLIEDEATEGKRRPKLGKFAAMLLRALGRPPPRLSLLMAAALSSPCVRLQRSLRSHVQLCSTVPRPVGRGNELWAEPQTSSSNGNESDAAESGPAESGVAAAGVPLPTLTPPTMVDAPHPVLLSSEEIYRECDVKHTRGSGPGGQHRNKVATGVLLKHRPTGISASAGEARSQMQNRDAALFRLRLRIALSLRSVPAEPTASALWKRRCKGAKLSVNERHADFPSLLSEALDRIWAIGDVKEAAVAQGISLSQLVRLLSQEPAALQWANALRASKGQGPLRASR
tara:strand:+ start:4238 stop:5107 length:870 start_codon:yes stop_codon:yes gene_type:complete